MESPLKRISLMLREDQYELITSENLNLSGLVRDLIDDHFSEAKITLSVSKETQGLYRQVVSNTGATDADLEPFLKAALHGVLKDKIQLMLKLEKTAFKGSSK